MTGGTPIIGPMGDGRERGAISVVIPVRDDVRVLECVASVLERHCEADALQVIVVDHASRPDISAQLAAELPAEVTIVPFNGETVYGARNAGVAAATGRYVYFTDADCIVRPGWIAEALAHLRTGADLVQGFSGSREHGRLDWLIQQRYEAHLRRLHPGEATECDTRNLAVRREVFAQLEFPGEWRRTGDTALGLLAELAGFRVEYCPAMRIDHAHERDLPLFLAKQVCHGWGAQRLMREHPDVRWHGGHLALVARLSRLSVRSGVKQPLASALGRVAASAGGSLQLVGPWLPARLALAALSALDKAAALAGHVGYESGADEPRPSALLGRRPVRD